MDFITDFMHLQPHAKMPDDDTTSDYRYDLLDRIMYADYVYKTSVCINYMRSHLIRPTADASSAYIARCETWGFYLTPQNTQLL